MGIRNVLILINNKVIPLSNQAQNAQTDAIAKKSGLTKDEARILYDEISHQGYGYQEILEIAKDLFNK